MGMLGDVLGFVGGLQSNKQARDQAAQSEHFAENMSSTAYQRAVWDMKEAGLNPMLAYSQGGASTPTRPMAQQENVGAAAISGHATAAQADVAEKQADNIAADTENKLATADNIRADTDLKRVSVPKVEQDTITSGTTADVNRKQVEVFASQINKQIQEISSMKTEQQKSQATIKLIQAQVLHTGASKLQLMEATRKIQQEIQNLGVDNVLKTLQLPESEAAAQKFKTDWGKFVSPYIQDIGTAAGAGANIRK